MVIYIDRLAWIQDSMMYWTLWLPQNGVTRFSQKDSANACAMASLDFVWSSYYPRRLETVIIGAFFCAFPLVLHDLVPSILCVFWYWNCSKCVNLLALAIRDHVTVESSRWSLSPGSLVWIYFDTNTFISTLLTRNYHG